MDILVLRLAAPLMSFGAVVVDQFNRTEAFPYRAMLTGLLANALGWTRQDAAAHQRLQQRLRYGARADRPGSVLLDYQTVDFDPEGPMASRLGWTTWGRVEERGGGDAADGTHIRYRYYLEDAVLTVALTLAPADEQPALDELEAALRKPARPLFLGRKCCLPSEPIVRGRHQAGSLRALLAELPRAERAVKNPLSALWPLAEGHEETATRTLPRVEDRDWSNAIHVGRRLYVEGLVNPPERNT